MTRPRTGAGSRWPARRTGSSRASPGRWTGRNPRGAGVGRAPAGGGGGGRGGARARGREQANAAVAAWTRRLARDALLAAREAAQLPAGPVHAIDEIIADPHHAARGSIARVADRR